MSDEEDEYRRVDNMPNGEDEYIYRLKAKRAAKNRRIYTDAQFKDLSSQTWADITASASTYEVWKDEVVWEIKQAINRKSKTHKILLSNIE